ncbi:MAG: hypothetical protein ACRCUP_01075 [Mycoplasmatales bacterium]
MGVFRKSKEEMREFIFDSEDTANKFAERLAIDDDVMSIVNQVGDDWIITPLAAVPDKYYEEQERLWQVFYLFLLVHFCL